MTQRILVSGGAGFLGSHLCRVLLKKGYEVICVDDLSTGSYLNLEEFLDNPHFSYQVHDIIQPFKCKADQIFNFACRASPKYYQQDPIHTIKTNVFGVLNMLDLAKEHRAKIFQASTSEIYGDPLEHPQRESYVGSVDPIGKRACYDEGKRIAETLFTEYFRKYDTPMCIGRIFNTYGPRMHPQDGRVVSNFITQALKNEPLTIYGRGDQTRSFCYVEDLIDGVLALMQHPHYLGPINLGNPEEIAIGDLAYLILDLTGSKSKISFLDLPEGDPQIRCPDITTAKDKLGWEPQIPLKEGLLKTIYYFDAVLSKKKRLE